MGSGGVGLEVLGRAESELRTLIEGALAGGRYDEVATLAQLADGLATVRTGVVANGATAGSPLEGRGNKRPVPRVAATRTAGTTGSARYEREGEKLIKIAGKAGQGIYEHRAPFEVVDIALTTIKARKGMGARFTATDILPLRQPKTRREIPSYQAYLVLGWLRQEGVLIKYGRDTYSLKATACTPEHIQKLWKALPSRDE